MPEKIAFQGALGAYGHEACVKSRPLMEPLPCGTFDDTIQAVLSGDAAMAMLPVENTIYGRVADIHRLLPDSGLFIVGEEFLRVRIALMAQPGVKLKDIEIVRAHMVLLPQAHVFLREKGLATEVAIDGARAAQEIAMGGATKAAVLASELAAETYGLNVLARNVETEAHNTTRFLLMTREPDTSRRGDMMMTTFVFEVRNIPAALYKAMGGFATNNVNMTKLESYMVGGQFTATQFYADIEGHPDDAPVQRALDELGFFTSKVRVLGVYPAAASRKIS